MRLKHTAVLVLVAVSFLLAFGARAEEAVPDACEGLTNKAYSECVKQIQKSQRMTQKPVDKPPAWVGDPVIPRPYGYWIGDLTDLSYVMEFKTGVEADLSRLPGIGVRVGEYVVRDRTFTEVTLGDGTRQVTVWYLVQNFAVLCSQGYVRFGPLEAFWRRGSDAEWKRIEIPAADILVSPMSLCDETPDAKMAPREMIAFSRLMLARTVTAAGAALMLAAFVVWGLAFLTEFRRIETSPLYRARRALKRSGMTAAMAIKEFRSALREKFGIGGSDGSADVAVRIRDWRDARDQALYAEYADEAAGIWEKTLAILYEEDETPEDLVRIIRTFIGKLARREAEEV